MSNFIEGFIAWSTSKTKTKQELEKYKRDIESSKKDEDFIKIDYVEEFTKLN